MGKKRRSGKLMQPDKKKDNKKNGRIHAPHSLDPDTGRVSFVSPRQHAASPQQQQGYDPLWRSDFQYR